MGARAYRPQFRSQFDYNGHYDGYPNESGRTVNGKPARYWESKNCAFAAGAMGMDRTTLGAQKATPNDLRDVTSVVSPKGASLGDINHAWGKAHLITSGWTDQALEVHDSLAWADFTAAIQSGKGAVIVGFMGAIPTKYRCQSDFRGAHAMFIGEMDDAGNFLTFDPICRPSDKLGANVDRTMLDSQYANQTTEDQPHWIPGQYVKSYCESWFGRDARGNPRHPGRVQCGFTAKTPVGSGGDILTPDVWAVYADGSWVEQVVSAASPDDVEQIQRVWEVGEIWDGAYNLDSLELPGPEIVISGEEGRVNDWAPTSMGYGVQGPAFYLASGSNKGARSRVHGWFLHPWDIPAEYFFTDPPDWPEGKAYLDEAIVLMNRRVGAQAFDVVNRASLWEQIELGGIYTLSQSLLGPFPDGLTMTVRVLGFAPDEDSGTMQVIAEQLGDVTFDTPHPPANDVVEAVIDNAKAMFGVPYQLGAESHNQCDCSGLIYRIFADAGHLDLIGGSRLSSAGYTRFFNGIHRFTTDFSTAERGDLMVFRHHLSTTGRVVHMGIYLGNNKIISALTTTGVTRTLYNKISVDYYGLLKPAYPDANPHFTVMTTPEVDTDPEEGATPTETPPAQGEEVTLPSDPWH